MHLRRRRPADPHLRERGVTAAEYVGIALIAGIVIAAIVVVVSPATVAPQIQRAWCLITGNQGCAGAATANIDTRLPACETTNTAYRGELEGTAFSVNLGVNGTATVAEVRNPDGSTSYTVTFEGGGKLGAHAMFGAKGEFGLGEGLSADAKAAITAAGGVTFQFDSQEAANEFVSQTAIEAAEWAAASQAGPLAPIAKDGLDWLNGSYDPPAPKEYYVELGTKGSAEAAAAAGLEAKLGVDTSRALGMKVEPGEPGEPATYTVYYKGTDALTASLGLGATGEVTTQVAVSYRDGVPVSASVEGAGKLKSSLLGGGEVGGGIPLGPGTGTPVVGASGSGVYRGRVALELDLTNPDNLNTVADVLNSTGLPVLPGHGTGTNPGPADAVGNLADRFTQAGPQGGASFTTQEYEGAEGELGLGVWAGDLLAFGAGGKVSVSELTATNASYYDPAVGGMVAWRRCGG
ncbi:MAG: hypothetical protein ACRCSN_07210 [Dermatophilaceae bacterium]